MIHKLACPCGGKLQCLLCQGCGWYEYEPGPRGWMPFTCPTCQGNRILQHPGEPEEECPTCHRGAWIDPADSPVTFLGKVRKMFFGG